MTKMSLEMCRVCMVQGKNFDKLGTGKDSYGQKLNYCVPEIDLSLTENPLICQSCLSMLEKGYELRNKCLLTEEALKACLEVCGKTPQFRKYGIKFNNNSDHNENHENSLMEINGISEFAIETNQNDDNHTKNHQNLNDKILDSITKTNHNENTQNNLIDINDKISDSIAETNKNEHKCDNNENNHLLGINNKISNSVNHNEKDLEIFRTLKLMAVKHDKPQVENCKTVNLKREITHELIIKEEAMVIENEPGKIVDAMEINEQSDQDTRIQLRSSVRNTPAAVYNHSKKKTKGNIIKCLKCNRLFKNRGNLKTHMKTHNKFKCTLCSTWFENQIELDVHFQIHDLQSESMDENRCSDRDLESHEKSHVFCDLCNVCLENQKELEQHKMLHFEVEDKSLYHCDACGQYFTQEMYKLSHQCVASHTEIQSNDFVQSNEEEQIFTCDICGKVFPTKHRFNIHKKSHLDISHSCKICNKVYKGILSLLFHERSHMRPKERLHLCTICNVSFESKSLLKNHKYIMHDEEDYFKCSVCAKEFAVKQRLEIHMRVHTGEKPYQCDLCGKCFQIKGSLQVHKKIHTNEKPFQCHNCDKRFITKGNLLMHSRVHTGERPFACPICARRFTLKNTMIVHIRNKHKHENFEMDFMSDYAESFHDQLYEKFEAVYSEGSRDRSNVSSDDNLDAINELGNHAQTYVTDNLEQQNICSAEDEDV